MFQRLIVLGVLSCSMCSAFEIDGGYTADNDSVTGVVSGEPRSPKRHSPLAFKYYFELKELEATPLSTPEERALKMFDIGMSYLHSGEYQRATDWFINSMVTYPDERMLESIGLATQNNYIGENMSAFEMGLQTLRTYAHNKHQQACFLMGYFNETNVFTQPLPPVPTLTEKTHEEVARTWYKQAANQGQMNAMSRYADFLLKGIGGPKNKDMALHYYECAAKAGHPNALTYMCNAYALGLHGEIDLEKAAYWRRKALVPANYERALKVADRLFVSRRPSEYGKAVEIYEQVARFGHAATRHKLGLLHFLGHKVRLDDVLALDYFLENVYQYATEVEAVSLLQGFEKAENYEAQNKLIKKFAKKYPNVALYAAKRVKHIRFSKQNSAGALDYLKQACKAFSPEAEVIRLELHNELGQHRKLSSGLDKLAPHQQELIEHGLWGRYNYLSALNCIHKNRYQEAFVFLEKAAAAGKHEALLIIADLYYDGLTGATRLDMAERYYKLAYAKGVPQGAISLLKMAFAKQLFGTDDFVGAQRKWLEAAIELKSPLAMALKISQRVANDVD